MKERKDKICWEEEIYGDISGDISSHFLFAQEVILIILSFLVLLMPVAICLAKRRTLLGNSNRVYLKLGSVLGTGQPDLKKTYFYKAGFYCTHIYIYNDK